VAGFIQVIHFDSVHPRLCLGAALKTQALADMTISSKLVTRRFNAAYAD
jgi:hypothetical protein